MPRVMRFHLHRPSPRASLHALLVVAALVAFAILVARTGEAPGIEVERRSPAVGLDEVRVDVRGAVAHPGVVVTEPGDRVADVIEHAGGARSDADLDRLNLARRVVDGERIDVPAHGEAATSALIDLNTASEADLQELPGIGPARARAIVAARAEAAFVSSDDLVDRGVLPESVYEAIRDLVTTGDR